MGSRSPWTLCAGHYNGANNHPYLQAMEGQLTAFEPNMWRRRSMAPAMIGVENTLELRIQQQDKEAGKAVSLWHDISLRAPTLPGMDDDVELYNFICEVRSTHSMPRVPPTRHPCF